MGMAASQARFLGLTARKSNVEYQGQQINQQRTALATESSNLFHQMMTLNVPTPPVTTDYYKTTYTLDNSALGNCSAYTIESLTKTNNATNQYTVKLNTVETQTSASADTYSLTKIVKDDSIYTVTLNGSYVTFDTNTENQKAYKPDSTTNSNSGSTNSSKNVLAISKNKIYKIDKETKKLLGSNDGYNATLAELDKDGCSPTEEKPLYFYQDGAGNNIYLTQDALNRITSDAFTSNPPYECTYNTNDYQTATSVSIAAGTYATTYRSIDKYIDITREVNATIDSTSSGRYSSITIEPNENYPSHLSGKSFSITTASAPDENAYKDAYSDYEFEKNLYEQRIAEINAKTEIIQSEDKQLELRLQQLDTEQESIKTEMDSVQKVIEDNVQKTFDAFG